MTAIAVIASSGCIGLVITALDYRNERDSLAAIELGLWTAGVTASIIGAATLALI